ncbi:MAG: glycosyltransferase family 2 protein [Litorimonas sp.]
MVDTKNTDTLVSKGAGKADITICIPTFEAQSFIGRTLGFATGQTRKNIRILVSVDKSEDRTFEICRSIAQSDPRIEVYQHEDRVGWAGNVASLIRRVETPYFFVYFHDDFISPHYCDRMVRPLEENPELASSNCSVGYIGRREGQTLAHSYPAEPVGRMLTMLANDQIPGAPLRSMIRTEMFDISNLLRPGISPGEMFQAYCMHSAIMLAGPAIGVPELLYTRWIRDNALTTSPKKPDCVRLRDIWLKNVEVLWPHLERKISNEQDLEIVHYTFLLRALWVIMMASDASRACIDDLWVLNPELPRLEVAPIPHLTDNSITSSIIQLRAKVLDKINDLP